MSLKFGYHLPGGISSVKEAVKRGFSAVQCFPGHNTFKIAKKYSVEEKSDVRSILRDTGISMFFHAAYSAVIASDMSVRKQTQEYLQKILDLAGDVGIEGVVVHTGSSSREGTLELAESMIRSLAIPEGVTLLLESMASKKDLLQGLFKFIPGVDSLRVKYCLDTCHVYSYGVDLTDSLVRDSYFKTVADRVGLVHLNNVPLGLQVGCGRDRHEFMQKGVMVGSEIINWASKFNVPLILERSSSMSYVDADVDNELGLLTSVLGCSS